LTHNLKQEGELDILWVGVKITWVAGSKYHR